MVAAWLSIASQALEMISALVAVLVMFTASGSGEGCAAPRVELGEDQLVVARHLPVAPVAVEPFCVAALASAACNVEPVGACHGVVSLGTPIV